MRAELRGLSEASAEIVGGHLLMAATLMDEDPQLAHKHADAARRRAARLPVVREMAGEAAYAAEDYAAALNEFRTVRRMTGSNDFLALAADCERGLGRPQAALELVREGLGASPSMQLFVELKIVQAGARADLGQRDEAERVLRVELDRPSISGPLRGRLAYALGALRESAGDETGALEWFSVAARLDKTGDTDAAERVERLSGLLITVDLELLDAPSADELDAEDESREGVDDVPDGDDVQDEEPLDDPSDLTPDTDENA